PSLALLVLGAAATADNHAVTRAIGAAGAALELTPRGDRVTATGGLALATTVRVVHRVHDDAADLRAPALPAHAAGLAPADVDLLGVADLTDGGAAARVDAADFGRRHAQDGVLALLAQQLDGRTGRTGQLRAGTRGHRGALGGRAVRVV